jgi:hypothetical protein
MKVDQKGHTTTLRNTQGDCQAFLEKITNQYPTFQTQNLILDLSKDKTVSLKEIKLFSSLSKQHKKNKKSLVLVVDEVDIDKIPQSMSVVPTLLEAHDTIEIEEIERDLGF